MTDERLNKLREENERLKAQILRMLNMTEKDIQQQDSGLTLDEVLEEK